MKQQGIYKSPQLNPSQSSVHPTGGGGANVNSKQSSSRRASYDKNSTVISSSSSSLRPSTIGSAFVKPVPKSTAGNTALSPSHDLEQEQRSREFLSSASKKPTHSRGGSDSEFAEDTVLIAPPGGRGNSPNPPPHAENLMCRPHRPKNIRHDSAPTQPQQSPQQPVLVAQQVPDTFGVIRPRSQSLDSKGTSNTFSSSTTSSASTPRVVQRTSPLNLPNTGHAPKRSSSPQSYLRAGGDKYLNQPQVPATTQPQQPNSGGQIGSGSSAVPGKSGSGATSTASGGGPVSVADMLSLLGQLDLASGTEEQREGLQSMLHRTLQTLDEQRKSSSVQPSTALSHQADHTSQSQSQPQSQSRHHNKEDSLGEISSFAPHLEAMFVDVARRNGSQDAEKMFDSARKPPSPHLTFGNESPEVNPIVLSSKPAGKQPNTGQSVPDLSKSRNIVSPSSAFFSPSNWPVTSGNSPQNPISD